MKFRSKLMLSYLLLSLLITGSFYIFFTHYLQKSLIEESRTNLSSMATLVKLVIERDGQSLPVQQLAEKIGSSINARVTLIAADGRVVGDSDIRLAKLAELQNHLDRSEVQSAIKTGSGSSVRYSETLRLHMLYVALTTGKPDKGVNFVRLSLPLDYLATATNSVHGLLGGIAVLTLLAALILSYMLSNLISRPLREIAAAAARIGKGEPCVAIAATCQDEIGELAYVINDMSRRIDIQVKSLSAEKQRLDTILGGMGEGVMVASSDGVISLVNPAFRSLFGIDKNVEGKSLIEISRHPDLLSAFNELRSSGGELAREIVIPTKNMTLFTHWVPLMVDGGDQGVVAVFHDITNMKNVENIRRDFVANVSHELRTPVSIIKGYAETLLDGLIEADPQRAERFVEIIRHHSERLTLLINDILTLSHLESKEAALELHPLDVSGAITNARMSLEESALKKDIVLKNEITEGLPRIMADQGRLEQVLINLLENAIKYTPEGGIVRLFTEDDREFIKVSVADNGIGIPLKDLGRIFERFYRVDGARSREQGGTGLGLSIVKHIVQLHGGEVAVSSEPGRGSVFSFTLRKA